MSGDLKTSLDTAARDLKRDVTSGLRWTAVGRAAQQFLQFGLSVVLARLLSPKDYGLMAMSVVFTGFAGMLADAGFNAAIVQRKELKESHIHTVFWMTFGSGLALTLITFALSPWLADFFNAPSLKPIFRAIALNFIFGGLGNVPSALLQRRMQFRRIATIDISSLLLSGIVGVVMALAGAGVWSLVGQSVSASLLTSALRCISCRWLPKPTFCGDSLKEIWSFSGHLYGFNFINYWARNADNLLVGKFFGAPALGTYNRAYALMLLPVTQINSIISQVIFPALSGIQDDKQRVKRIYLRAIGVVTLLAFPIMFGMFVTARRFVETIYGPKWAGLVPIVQILSLIGAMQVLFNSTGWLFMSQGKTRAMFKWGSFFAVAAITSFIAGVLIGSVKAVASCYAVVNVAYFYPCLAVGAKVIDAQANEILKSAAGPFVCSLLMAIVVWFLSSLLPSDWSSPQAFLVLVVAGALVYVTAIHLAQLSAWKEIIRSLSKRLKPDLRLRSA